MSIITKPFFTVLFLLTTSTLLAQNVPFRFGFKAGLNLSSLTLDNDGIRNNRIKPGINIGLTGNYNFSKNFFLQTGLAFSTKGAIIKGKEPLGFPSYAMTEGNTEPVLKSNQMYLQIPLHLGYNFALGSKRKITFNTGPYIARGVGGKTVLSGNMVYGDMIDNTPVEEKTFGSRGLRKLDYGMNAGAGIDLGQVILALNYELGLKNIQPEKATYFPFYNNSYKNRNLSLTVEFKF